MLIVRESNVNLTLIWQTNNRNIYELCTTVNRIASFELIKS